MFKKILALLVALLITPLSGCILEDTRHTLFIAPDGSVTWRVLRDIIRSDEDHPLDRLAEEEELLEKLAAGEEGWVETLLDYGALGASAALVRAERPYTVLVRARFGSIEQLCGAFLDEADASGEVRFEEEGSLRTLHLLLIPAEAVHESGEEESDEEESTTDDLRLVLTQGRFIEAQGFRLSSDGTIATPLAPPADAQQLEYALVWDLEA